MNGAQQILTYVMTPLADGMGLLIGTPSYNGTISFNVTSTRETMPDIEFFVDCIRDSLAELLKATRPKKRRRTTVN